MKDSLQGTQNNYRNALGMQIYWCRKDNREVVLTMFLLLNITWQITYY
jgi:hypothetical protein